MLSPKRGITGLRERMRKPLRNLWHGIAPWIPSTVPESDNFEDRACNVTFARQQKPGEAGNPGDFTFREFDGLARFCSDGEFVVSKAGEELNV
jgi:hypothetical protein